MANSSITHEYEATVFDWHPTERILAIGWADGMKNLDIIVKNCIVTCFIHVLIDEFVGMVSCWTVDGKNKPTSTFSNNVQHSTTITVLKWNPSGKRLVTGDKVLFI